MPYRFPEYRNKILEHMYQEGDYYVVPYTRFTIEDPEFYQCMESFEVYDNRVGAEVFVDLHLKKWITFGKEKEAVDEYIVLSAPSFKIISMSFFCFITARRRRSRNI